MMKLFKAAALCSFACVLAAGNPASAASRVIVLAEDYTEAEAQAILDKAGPIFESLQPSDRLIVMSAGPKGSLIDLKIPDDPVYGKHPVHRRKLLVPSYTRLAVYLKETIRTGAGNRSGQRSQVNLPKVLKSLSYVADLKPNVMVYGNPIYHDERTPQFSMEKGYPTDGHYGLPPGRSPYGVAGLEDSLAGTLIHFCSSDARWKNGAHEEGVERTNALLAEGHGARLATFTDDLGRCARRFVDGSSCGTRDFKPDAGDTRVAMIDVSEFLTIPPELQLEIDQGIVKMHSLHLYDTDKVDGDVVRVVATGFALRVDLKKRPQAVRVPVTRGALHVEGVKDGGGGITVGIKTSSGAVIVSRSIKPGERIRIPIRPNS